MNSSDSAGAANRGEHRGAGFSVRIEQGFRELVRVVYERQGISLNLEGEHLFGRSGISVLIPENVDEARAVAIAADLKAAFRALGHSYIVARQAGVDVVPEQERQAAITELREMGCELDISPDRNQIALRPIPGAPKIDAEAARQQSQRMASLLNAVHGQRPRLAILADSEDPSP